MVQRKNQSNYYINKYETFAVIGLAIYAFWSTKWFGVMNGLLLISDAGFLTNNGQHFVSVQN